MDRTVDYMAGWIAVFVGIGIALMVGIGVAIAYYILLLCIQAYRYRQYQFQAEGTAQRVIREHGDFQAQDVGRIWFGANPQGTYQHHAGELLFGVEVQR